MIFTDVITNKAYLMTLPADVWLIFSQTTEINESFCLIFKHEFSQITKKKKTYFLINHKAASTTDEI